MPSPLRRRSSATKIAPTQPTRPLTVATPVPTTRPSASATSGKHVGWADRPLEEDRPVAPAAVEDHLRGLRDVGGEHRPDPGGGGRLGHPLTIPSRPDRGLGYHRAVATLSRSDVEHVAHLARLGLTDDELARLEGQLNHILDQYVMLTRARHRGHPADGPDDRAREHPPRRRRPRVAAGRGRPAQRLADRRRLHRRAGDPRRRVGDEADRRDRRTALTRLHAHEMASRLRPGELSVARAGRGPPRRRRAREPRAQRVALDRPRECARPGRRRRRPAGRRPRRGRPAIRALHPLLGIPVALKDLISVEGGQCTAGSRILEGYIAPYDAHITERLRDVGAVILGKTNMDEFAMGSSNEHSAYGPVSNPWDLETVPGGSSGGSAVAVAAYHAPLSLGHRHRRLDPPARRADRHRRDEADVRPGVALRDRRVRQLARPDRPVRPRRARRGGAAPRGRRPRRARLDLRAGPGARTSCSSCRRATTRPRRGSRASGWACRRSTSSPAWSPTSRRGSTRRSPRSRPPARPSRRSACRTPTTASRRTTSSRRPRRRRTSPATTGSASGRGSATATSSATTSRRAATASGRRSSAGSCSARTRCRPATTTRST